MTVPHATPDTIRAGMVGVGMIFEETYWPFFQQVARPAPVSPQTGPVEVELRPWPAAPGAGRAAYLRQRRSRAALPRRTAPGHGRVDALLESGVDAVCIATPDDRHFEACATRRSRRASTS